MWLLHQVRHGVDDARGEPGPAQDTRGFVGGDRTDQLRELLSHAHGIVDSRTPETRERVGEFTPARGRRGDEAPLDGLDGQAARIER